MDKMKKGSWTPYILWDGAMELVSWAHALFFKTREDSEGNLDIIKASSSVSGSWEWDIALLSDDNHPDSWGRNLEMEPPGDLGAGPAPEVVETGLLSQGVWKAASNQRRLFLSLKI